MKVILIHGDDTIASRKRYSDIITSIKKRGWEINHIDKESKLSLSESLVSSSLFPESTLYIVENFSKLPESELVWLCKHSDNIEGNLLFFHHDVVSAKLLKLLPKSAKNEIFTLPKLLFVFLESLKPKNATLCLRYLVELKKNTPLELILAMMGKHFRDLFWAKQAKIIPGVPQWRLSKLLAQANSFEVKKLAEFIDSLARIDIEAKTGKSNLDMSLDLTIVKLLQ